MTSPTLTIELKNATTSNTVFAYVTGTALDSGNNLWLLQSDGASPYFPVSPANTQSPLAVNCAIPLGPPGSTRPVTVPHLAGARIWFCVDGQLTFLLNPGPALVEPSVSNLSDPNINKNWAFAEFTYNDAQVFANVSYVDFLSLPVALTLQNFSGGQQAVLGMPPDALSTAVSRLQAQDNRDGAGWSKLVQNAPSGQPLRVISPNLAIVMDPNFQVNYWTGYVNDVFTKFSSQDLSVDTQGPLGTISGQVSNNAFQLGGQSFGKPSARDIYSCNSGPFDVQGNNVRAGIIPRLAAAFNRTTLLTDNSIPNNPPLFYRNFVTNHYSRVIHSVELDGRGYAFPYDDVGATGGVDLSGSVSDGNPRVLTVAVGGN